MRRSVFEDSQLLANANMLIDPENKRGFYFILKMLDVTP